MDTLIQPQTNPSRPPSRQPARRRRRGRGWVLFFLFLAVLAVFAAAGYVYLDQLALDRVTVDTLSAAEGTTNYLIVGSDTREDLPDDLEGNFGDFSGARSDVIILAHVTDGRRQLLSLPRDLRVDIPGEGTNRINAAYAFGGPELLTETVIDETGVPIHHYLEVDFGGFASIIDAVGGIELDIPHPARDLKSGLEIDAGSQTVDGATALAYARSRQYEEFRDGEWVPQGGGDPGRTSRQREVMLQVLAKVGSPEVLLRTPGLVTAVSSNLTADDGLSLWDLLRTGVAMRFAGETDTVSLPVVSAPENGVAYVTRNEPEASDMIGAFLDGRPLETEE